LRVRDMIAADEFDIAEFLAKFFKVGSETVCNFGLGIVCVSRPTVYSLTEKNDENFGWRLLIPFGGERRRCGHRLFAEK